MPIHIAVQPAPVGGHRVGPGPRGVRRAAAAPACSAARSARGPPRTHVFERLGQRRTTLVLLVLLSITLITFDVRGSRAHRQRPPDRRRRVRAGCRRGAARSSGPFENTWHGIFDYESVKSERDAAGRPGATPAGRRHRRRRSGARVPRTGRRSTSCRRRPTCPRSTAQVVSEPASNFDRTVDIDQGTNQGLRVGMPVINGGGLIGRIEKVYGDRSTIRLVTDPNFSMAVKVVPGPDHPAAPAAPHTRRRDRRRRRRRPRTPVPPVRPRRHHRPTPPPPRRCPPPPRRCRSWSGAGSPARALARTCHWNRSRPRARSRPATSCRPVAWLESLAPADLPVGPRRRQAARHPGSGSAGGPRRAVGQPHQPQLVKVLLYCTECGEQREAERSARHSTVTSPWLRVPLVTIVALAIQPSFFTDMRPFDAVADVMLLLVLAAGMVAGPRTAPCVASAWASPTT